MTRAAKYLEYDNIISTCAVNYRNPMSEFIESVTYLANFMTDLKYFLINLISKNFLVGFMYTSYLL